MDYSKKQSQLDVKKWVDSEIKGSDTCGEYKYCSCCNKDAAYPCAYAYDKYSTITKLAKDTKTTSTTAKKSSTTRATSTTAKKSTTTKATSTTAKKSTTTKKTAKVAA